MLESTPVAIVVSLLFIGCMVLIYSSNTIFQKCLIRGVVTTEDIDEELASQEPLLLVPEELSITTTLAKRKLAPLLKKAGLPSLEVGC